MKISLTVVICAALSGIVAVLVAKMLGIESSAAIGGGVGGAIGAIVAVKLNSKSKNES